MTMMMLYKKMLTSNINWLRKMISAENDGSHIRYKIFDLTIHKQNVNAQNEPVGKYFIIYMHSIDDTIIEHPFYFENGNIYVESCHIIRGVGVIQYLIHSWFLVGAPNSKEISKKRYKEVKRKIIKNCKNFTKISKWF